MNGLNRITRSKRCSLVAVALLSLAATACIQSPENGDYVRESAVLPFYGYAQDDTITLQAEVVTGSRQDPNCVVDPCAIEICTPRGVCRCRPSTCPSVPVLGWQTFATTRADTTQPANLFVDQTYPLYTWAVNAQVPAGAYRTLTGRDGSTFRGARVRAIVNVSNTEFPFYTVKDDAVTCWNANHSTLSGWISACTPSTDNKVLELRSAGW